METAEGLAVEKRFQTAALAENEAKVYRLLEGTPLPHAQVLKSESDRLLLSYLPGITYAELLMQQESAGNLDYAPWDSLVNWIMDFHRCTGLVMTDVNLKNFLYDAAHQITYGIDFEECRQGNLVETAAQLCAFVRLYAPEDTPLKRQISNRLQSAFVSGLTVDRETLSEKTVAAMTAIRARRAR